VPANIKQNLKIVPVRWIDEVLERALEYQPTPLAPKLTGERKSKTASDNKTVTAH